MKTCRKCSGTKPISEFYNDPKGGGGKSATCKECHKARQREWGAKNKDRKSAYRKASMADPQKSAKAKEYWREYRAERLEQRRAQDREYGAKNSARIVERVRLWRLNNPERAKQGRLADQNRRRANLLNACPAWADEAAIDHIYDQAAKTTKATGVRHEVDHVIPLLGKSVCGLHVQTNLRIVPQTVNRRKSAKVVPELMAQMVAECIDRFNKGE